MTSKFSLGDVVGYSVKGAKNRTGNNLHVFERRGVVVVRITSLNTVEVYWGDKNNPIFSKWDQKGVYRNEDLDLRLIKFFEGEVEFEITMD